MFTVDSDTVCTAFASHQHLTITGITRNDSQASLRVDGGTAKKARASGCPQTARKTDQSDIYGGPSGNEKYPLSEKCDLRPDDETNADLRFQQNPIILWTASVDPSDWTRVSWNNQSMQL